MSRIPNSSLMLMRAVFQKIFPMVDKELRRWERKAENIPDSELRKQAIASIRAKRFHCQGGSVYSLLAGKQRKEAVRFIVAYQTISDYLDNLCDRSTSLDPADFELLHEAMRDALTPGNPARNYYRMRPEQEDGGYLQSLVETCQQVIGNIRSYSAIQQELMQLQSLYAELQIHKHVRMEERIPRLTAWFESNQEQTPDLSWHEFSAATGSTLGIFCLVSYSLGRQLSGEEAKAIKDGYYPYMQGLHILLDYFIDQQEDEEEGDLNFCSFFNDRQQMEERIVYFIRKSREAVKNLPDAKFHDMVRQGLVGLYLGDEKIDSIPNGSQMKKALLKASGNGATFMNWTIQFYYRMEK